MNTQILIAGFGGQGILFAGKFLAYEALTDNREVSWLPSYGPEMRGGTANCSIIISDNKIGSPIVDKPDILIAMNTPSYDKYIDAIVPGGKVFVDSSLIDRKCERTDISAHYIPATKMASDNELSGLANMIIIGNLIANTDFINSEKIESAMKHVVPAAKQNLFDLNMKAIELGIDFKN